MEQTLLKFLVVAFLGIIALQGSPTTQEQQQEPQEPQENPLEDSLPKKKTSEEKYYFTWKFFSYGV